MAIEQYMIDFIETHWIDFKFGEALTDRERVMFFNIVTFVKNRLDKDPKQTVFTVEADELDELIAHWTDGDLPNDISLTFNFLVSLRITEEARNKEQTCSIGALNVSWPFSSIILNERNEDFSFTIQPHLLDWIKHDYKTLIYNNTIRAGVTSKCGMALFGIILSDPDRFPWTVNFEDFKKEMGIDPGQYPRPNSLRERCIDVGIEEINANTNYELSFKQNKDGKTITGLTFFLIDEEL